MGYDSEVTISQERMSVRLKRSVAAVLCTVCAFPPLGLAAEPVTIGVYAYPPFGYSENDRQTGYTHDILRAAAGRAGLAVTVEEFPVVRAAELLHNAPNFIIGGTLTPESVVRHQGSAWPFCFETVSHSLLVKADSPYGRLEDVPHNASIGAFLGYTLIKYLNGLGFTDLVLTQQNSQVADMLASGRVDGWATFESSAYYIMDAKGMDRSSVKSVPIKQFPFCAIASRNTDPKVLSKLRAAYLSMAGDGTRDAIRARYAKYLGPDLPYEAIPKLP